MSAKDNDFKTDTVVHQSLDLGPNSGMSSPEHGGQGSSPKLKEKGGGRESPMDEDDLDNTNIDEEKPELPLTR